VAERRGAGAEVDGRHLAAADELDLLRGVQALGMDVDRVAVGPVLQVVLREGRPLVGAMRLGANEDDMSVEALLPQRLGRLRAREARAHDQEGRSLGHARLLGPSAGVSSLVSVALRSRPYGPAGGIRSWARSAASVPLVAITRTSSASWPGKSSGSMRTTGSVRSSPTVRHVAPPSALAWTR